MRFFSFCSTSISILFLALSATPAFAITIDNFQGTQSIEAFDGIPASSALPTGNSMGGFRAIQATASGAPGSLEVRTTSFAPFGLDHSQDFSITGTSIVHWDGNNDPNSIDFDGLGGIDLTEDTGTAFIIEGLGYDATAVGTIISITVYDASDPTGDTYSRYSLTLADGGSGQDYTFPFDSPTEAGPSGAADLTNVGAASITVNGDTPGVDLFFDNFNTNGTCPLIPGVGGKVLDDCGECIPPTDPSYNQSCLDCLGVPNGTTLPGDSCETGELGPCAPGIYNQECECERTSSPTVEVCDGADNNCNGEIDEIFPQIGEACGVTEDGCEISGVFICDENGGVKCDLDFENADLSGCGIEIGCDGIPGSGTKPDECGICGGDGSTCADLGCNSQDITELLFQLDQGAKNQERMIKSLTKIINRRTKKKRIRNRVKNIRQEANDRQVANWILSWTLPLVSVECTSTLASDFCVTSDNNIILDEYRAGSVGLRDLGNTASRLLRRVSGKPKLAKRWRTRLERLHQKNLAVAEQVPETQTTCTTLT